MILFDPNRQFSFQIQIGTFGSKIIFEHFEQDVLQ